MGKRRWLSGMVMVVFILSVVSQAAEVKAPGVRSRAEVQEVLGKAPKVLEAEKLRPLHIVLIAYKKDHGPDEHDYPLWQKRWGVLLGGMEGGVALDKQVNLYGPPVRGGEKEIFEGAEKVKVSLAYEWPNKKQLETADLMVMFCYGKWNEKKAADLERYLKRGGGFVLLHPAVIVPEGKDLLERMTKLVGLAWEQGYTRWRHGAMKLKIEAVEHPITKGLPKTIELLDEAYWPLRGDRSKVTILATSQETISKDSKATKPEPMFYLYEYGKGKVFSCILGHYTWTFDDPYFRILMLRGMAWAAGESPYRFDSLVLRGIALK